MAFVFTRASANSHTSTRGVGALRRPVPEPRTELVRHRTDPELPDQLRDRCLSGRPLRVEGNTPHERSASARAPTRSPATWWRRRRSRPTFVDAAVKAGTDRDASNALLRRISDETIISEFWVSDENGEIAFHEHRGRQLLVSHGPVGGLPRVPVRDPPDPGNRPWLCGAPRSSA